MPAEQNKKLIKYLQQNRFALLWIGLVLLFFYGAIITAFPPQFQSIANRMAVGLLLTFLQAVVGQLYLTVIVARLVGLHVAEAADTKD